jgi:hypothetical protein
MAPDARPSPEPKDTNMWRELVARYAILAREFSEEVALLGKEAALLGKEAYLGPEASRDRLAAIRTKHDLCVAVAGQVDDYLNQGTGRCPGGGHL